MTRKVANLESDPLTLAEMIHVALFLLWLKNNFATIIKVNSLGYGILLCCYNWSINTFGYGIIMLLQLIYLHTWLWYSIILP